MRINRVLIIVFALLLIPRFAMGIEERVIATGAATSCFPDYVCGEWGDCVDSLQTRVCEDQRCDRREITERRVCGVSDCIPDIVCGEWEDRCIYTDKIQNIINGTISFGGYNSRLCVDNNGCIESYTDEQACEESFDITLKEVRECGERYLIAYDTSSDRRVAKINVDSWESQNKLDISLSDSRSVYCKSCFNSIKDGDEEGVDCGGSCEACEKQNNTPEILLASTLWLFFALFSVVLSIEVIKVYRIWKLRKYNNRGAKDVFIKK